jgi:2-keto-4-pentenoate hydratase
MEGLAAALWKARGDGSMVAREIVKTPLSTDEAYAIQMAQIELAESALVGWKLGATTAPALELLGVAEPFIGPIFDDQRFESGQDVLLKAAHGPGLETEITAILFADLPARGEDYSRAEIEAAIGAVCPSFEIVCFRFTGGLADAGTLAIADGGAHGVMILGEPVDDWRRFDLSDHALSLRVNDDPVMESSNKVLLWDDTVDAVAWLANHPALGARGLRAGEVVMTGTCTGMIAVGAGDRAEADFGELGKISARFS